MDVEDFPVVIAEEVLQAGLDRNLILTFIITVISMVMKEDESREIYELF